MSESSRQRTTTIKARKKPRQKRSQAMVEKILSKTKDLLVRDGLRSLTTNRVADAAQISVGSLYQYFPNKGYTDLMVDGAPSPHQSDTTLRWLIDRLRS